MSRPRRWSALAVALVAGLTLGACGGGSDADDEGQGTQEAAGDPVAGGAATIAIVSEPRGLDPAFLSNVYSRDAMIGNALYGTLLTNDADTTEIRPSMAESLETADGGATFTLTLREGLTFSDGSPLDAEAVKANWDRHKDPAVASQSLGEASQVAATEVTGPTTLSITLTAPNASFAQLVTVSGLNWIAAPAALQLGQAAYDEAPVGAGPFTLTEWSRQDAIRLARNDSYWDAPKPYLDELVLRPIADPDQRLNLVTTGGAQAMMETDVRALARAEEQGVATIVSQTLNGGGNLEFNTRIAPFDDPRAREAVALAVDLDVINASVFGGAGDVPRSLFIEDSPYYVGETVPASDAERAQELFDELADEGKPLSFSLITFPTDQNRLAGESIATQLSAFDNVTVQLENLDFAGAGAAYVQRRFQAINSGTVFQTPEPGLWLAFHGTSRSNYSGIDDPELNEALDAARVATTEEERAEAYAVVEERFAELHPTLLWSRQTVALVGNDLTGGVMYGRGSFLVDGLWLAG